MTTKSYKKQDGKTYWEAYGYIGIDPKTGKQMRKRIRGFKTKREAEKAFSNIKLSEKTERITFEEAYERWLSLYERTVRASTLHKTKTLFRLHILPAVGHFFMDAVKLKDLQPIVTKWCDELAKGTTIKNYVSSVFDDAVRHGEIQDNPCDKVITHKKESKKKKKLFLEKHELESFLKAAKDIDLQWYTFFRLLAYTGIRRGEALALEWSDLKGGELSINKALQGTEDGQKLGETKTKGSNRIIDLDEVTLSDLQKWRLAQIKLYGVQPLMFCNAKKSYFSFSKPSHVLNRIFKVCGVEPISTHGFRHTHTAILAELGVDLGAIQKRLGHSDIATTMNIYHHVTQRVKDDLIKKLASY